MRSPPTSASTTASRSRTANSGPGWWRTRCRWPGRCGRSMSSAPATRAIPPRGAPRSAGQSSVSPEVAVFLGIYGVNRVLHIYPIVCAARTA
ncbi:protein of unknown function [Streptomyces sp. KY75]|nr:protein of unknown function [Streptomyces sp. KY75]